MYKENSLLQLKDILQIFMNQSNIHSHASHPYKLKVETFIKQHFPALKPIFGKVRIADKTYSGWKHLSIKTI